MPRRKSESPEETEARMAREAAERNLRETQGKWSEVTSLAAIFHEIHKGSNGVAFLEDIAEAMEPRRRSP